MALLVKTQRYKRLLHSFKAAAGLRM